MFLSSILVPETDFTHTEILIAEMAINRRTRTIPLTNFTFQSPSGKSEDGSTLPAVPLVPTETSVPTNIHLDLQRTGHIRDPHIGMNEKNVQWIHDRDWVYQTTFQVEEEWREDIIVGKATMEIIFEGLDTFGIVFLNGNEIVR